MSKVKLQTAERRAESDPGRKPLTAVIIGGGFAGVGMAIALKRRGVEDFVLVEGKGDVGGVWRDNSYPGAACDVPSHLYSYSFEPNPNWTHVFAPQKEIYDYIVNCARKYDVMPHVRLRTSVASADYDEADQLWTLKLSDGDQISTRLLISAVGQLSRPSIPKLPGSDTLQIPAFHSARWDHSLPLEGKRVAVIGTGASAIQFVPTIADQVASMTVFQRSPAHILPRPDRAYTDLEKARFARSDWRMKAARLGTYLSYESRAIAMTRFSGLLKYFVGGPFQKLLNKQVPDPDLRQKLTPTYPYGCKRILLSSEYLAAIAKPHVSVVTDAIRKLSPSGVETVDGVTREFDVIIWGTGFAATEFLAPMKITGANGVDLNVAWRDGASAYLGLSVPGFPNFFMLYGPNTNLGHNSIIYMLESQIDHIVRCLDQMKASGATRVEVRPEVYARRDAETQARLAKSIWSGCSSWYLDKSGRNTTNWPGFTFTYRYLARHASLDAYRFTRRQSVEGVATTTVLPPQGGFERAMAACLKAVLRIGFRPLIGPPFGARLQRFVANALSVGMPGVAASRRQIKGAGGGVEIVTASGTKDGAILYLHGGAFCLGGPYTHRSMTTRLARSSHRQVWAPDYRLSPEHPYPAALDDALACWDMMLAADHAPAHILLAGDSAGGALALALALRLRDAGRPGPAGLALVSPVTDPTLNGASLTGAQRNDPMLRADWLKQALHWYAAPPSANEHRPLESDLSGLTPMLIQVGDQEILLSDSLRLAERARACGVDCAVEVHKDRWHVFHLQAPYLGSSRHAIEALSEFANARLATPADGRTTGVAVAA
jgi:cation diffusion facilitator CzcD-associated flavoprotein CzcO/acetyl esterase/lipase